MFSPQRLAVQAAVTARSLRAIASTGIVRPVAPHHLVTLLRATGRWKATPAAGYIANGSIRAGRTAIIDELGSLTFKQVDERTNALANELSNAGIGPGDKIAILCRNHRGWVDATVAVSKLGAGALYLNTMFAGPQIADVCRREQPVAMIFDEEFAELVAEGAAGLLRYVAWHDGERPAGADPTLEQLIARGSTRPLPPPAEPGRVTILTSGTTGTPKGANRSLPKSPLVSAGLVDRIPYRAEQKMMVAAPLFHSWGYAHFTVGMLLGSTLVLQRRFSPEAMLEAVARERCQSLIVVPVMLQRTLELPAGAIERHDLSSLELIAASGSALPGPLAIEVMDRIGDVLYNLYGSTEVAWATIATPEELRDAPGTAGRPPVGTVLKLLDDDGNEVPQGQTGRIFVGNEIQFEGYTGGGNKAMVAGLMSSGDVGHLDEQGRLFIDGRDDEMIVSGGENLYPREVEDAIAGIDGIDEVAVIGVPDKDFGQRLRAFAVRSAGSDVGEDEIKAHVKANLASFKAPREVIFLDQLPRNATGKVLKRELAGHGDDSEG